MSTSLSRRPASAVHPTRQQLDDLDALLKRMLDLPVNRLEDEADDDEANSQDEADAAPSAPSAAEPMRGPHRTALSRPAEKAAPFSPVQYNTTPSDEADLKPRVIIVAPNSPENVTNSAAIAPAPTPEQKPIMDRPEDWVPLTSSWRPSSRTWKPLTEAWEQAQGIDTETGRQGEEEKRRQGEEETKAEFARLAAPDPKSDAETHSLPPVSLAPLELVSLAPSGAVKPEATPLSTAPAVEWTPWYLWPVVGFNAAFDLCLWPWGPVGRLLRGPTGRAMLGILGLLCLTAAAALAAADWIGWTS